MMKITVSFISDSLIQGMRSPSPLFSITISLFLYIYMYIWKICGMNVCVGITCLPLKFMCGNFSHLI